MKRMLYVLVAGLAVAAFPRLLSAQEEQEADPLADIAADMNAAAIRLAKLKTDKPTQKPQQDAVAKLDLLIKELEERAKNMGGSMVNPNATRPAQQSTIRNGPGGMGKLHAERQEGKQWGELPPKERARILQSMNEGFPSHYQKLLEKYFARLADEKSAGETADEPAGGKSSSRSEEGASGDAKAKPKTESDSK
jgi:acyl-CoA reductase-like NAD-dependent aldehyde dehydrogenase